MTTRTELKQKLKIKEVELEEYKFYKSLVPANKSTEHHDNCINIIEKQIELLKTKLEAIRRIHIPISVN